METIIVLAIVGIVLVLAARSFYRTLTGKNDGCGCGTKSCCTSQKCASPVLDKRRQEVRSHR